MPPHPIITLIAAMAENRIIGGNNRIPWHLPADLQHFKRLTLHKPIVMGRRTWESLPGPLPQRIHIVVTRNPYYRAPGCLLAATPEAAIHAAGAVPEVMVIGGATLYRALLPLAHRMYLTLVQGAFAGDVLFPEWKPSEWEQRSREAHPPDTRNPVGYTFITLERIQEANQSSIQGLSEPGQLT